MTNSQDGKSHGSDGDQLDALLKRLFERAKAGENSDPLYQNEYVSDVLGKGFDPYVKSTREVEIDNLKIVRYFPVCSIELLANLMSKVQPKEVKELYLEAITQAESLGDFTREISTERKSRIEELLSTIKSYDVEIIDSYAKENESDKFTKETVIIGNVYELSNLLKDPKQITADYARKVVDTFVDFAGKMQTEEFSINELKLDIDISDMKVTPPKLPEGYWK